VPAFLAYSAVWSACWFLLGAGAGEWIASVLGSLAFVSVCGWRFGSFRSFGVAAGIFVLVHTAGYFAGGNVMAWWVGADAAARFPAIPKEGRILAGMLGWGLFYGLGFGAGIGIVFQAFQPKAPAGATTNPEFPA